MEIRELRIGNLVGVGENALHADGGKNEIYEISELKTDVVQFRNFHSGEYYKDLRHIPLTEEWLLKFGFQRHDEGSVSAQFSYGTNPVTQDYLIYLKWIKDYENDYQLNGFPFYQNGHFEIKTVHQLQNLFFSLCGEELNVK